MSEGETPPGIYDIQAAMTLSLFWALLGMPPATIFSATVYLNDSTEYYLDGTNASLPAPPALLGVAAPSPRPAALRDGRAGARIATRLSSLRSSEVIHRCRRSHGRLMSSQSSGRSSARPSRTASSRS